MQEKVLKYSTRYMSTMRSEPALRCMLKCAPHRGFALPTVIFLMVIVAGLLASMVKLSMQQSASVDLILLSSKADTATRSALEWATYEIKTNNACPGTAPEIDHHTITISCAATSFEEASPTVANNRFRYDLVIRAESAAGDRTSPDYAFRRLDVTLMVEN